MMTPVHPVLADAARSRLLIIDVQERFVPAMHEIDATIVNIRRLAEAASLCHVPITATEQVPEKLGPTVEAIRRLVPQPIAKSAFSAAGCCDADPQRGQMILCGIESHVCVMQTALDMLAEGDDVLVVSDAITSRSPHNHSAAIARLLAQGANVVTTEMVLFEWMQDATHPAFRAISKLVR